MSGTPRTYTEGIFFKRYWEWFTAPRDIAGVDSADFISYVSVTIDGFHKTESQTSFIDLSQSLDAIWIGVRAGFVRKQIEQGRRRGVTVRRDDDFAAFYRLYRDFCRRIKKASYVSRRSLQENGILFTAYYQEALIAGGVFIGDGVYLRAWVLASARGTAHNGRTRDVIGSANRAVLWEAIRFGKEHGYKTFDLGGIAPDDPDPHVRDISVFKEAFGGKRGMQYAYYKVYSPLLRVWRSIYFRIFA